MIKSGIAMALGFNEKNLIGKHVFERSLELHTALNDGTNAVQYIENAVVPQLVPCCLSNGTE